MAQPMRKLRPEASPAEWFGNELRRLRLAAKLSATALGQSVQVSGSVILKIEKGEYPGCQLDLAQLLDAELGTDGLFERAWPMVFNRNHADKERTDADRQATSKGEAPCLAASGLMLGGDELESRPGSHQPVNRRTFLNAGSLAALTPTDLAKYLASDPQPLLPDVIRTTDISQVHTVASAISGWDNSFGGGGIVRHQATKAMQWAVSLLNSQCPTDLRPDLTAAVARLGVVVGATAFDAYAHDDATRAFAFAAACAEEAGDWHLRAKAYSLLARQAVWIGRPDDGLTHAEKGLVRADRLTATEQAMLHTARARAFGAMGNARDTTTAVGLADDAFSRARPQDDPPHMAYYDAAQHAGDTAHALFALAVRGRHTPGGAQRRFTAAVDGHTDDYKRSRAISRTKLATLIMVTGDPRQAAQVGNTALDEVGRLTSRRAADDVRELGRAAATYAKIPEVAALRQRVATAVRA